jgi:streptogramin lyase
MKEATKTMNSKSFLVDLFPRFARGFIGRFDPKTEKVEEWPSPGGPTSRPTALLQREMVLFGTVSPA